MKKITTHNEQIVSLRRIEGQIRGIQKMIDEKRYCINILTQLHAVVNAVLRVEEKILKKHFEGCVVHALKSSSAIEKQKKIDEILDLLHKFRKV